MNEYYYIARRKLRNMPARYIGDGIWRAKNLTQAKKEIARNYLTSVAHVTVERRSNGELEPCNCAMH
jgi:hypothetical protein